MSHTAASDPAWRSLGPVNVAGRVLSLAFDPSAPEILYAGSASGGIWKTSDGGATWAALGDELPTLAVGAIALSTRTPGTIVVGTGEPNVAQDALYGLGILRSTDGGSTWQQTNVVEVPFGVFSGYHAIEANPITGVMLAAGRSGLLRSEDDGATWSAVVSGGNWTDVKWRPGSADSAFAAREYDGLHVSTDGGRTFSLLTTGLPSPASIGGLTRIAVSSRNPQYIYAGFSATDSFTTLGVYRSTDGGATWELRSTQPDIYGYQGDYNNTIAIDPLDPDRVFAGGVFLFRSTDGAATWEPIGFDVHVDHHAVAFRPGPAPELWVGTDGGIFQSPDGGDSWDDRNRGLVTVQFYDICVPPADSTVIYGGSQDNGTARYLGSGEWEVRPRADGGICLCDPGDPRHMYGEYELGGHFVSFDGLQTWSLITNGLAEPSRFVAPTDLDPHDPMRLFTATSSALYRAADGGGSWTRVSDANDVISVSASPVTQARVWALERSTGIVRTSADGGTTWSFSMAAPFAGVAGTKILADPQDSLAAFCTFLHHPSAAPLVLRTRDGGLTWSDVTGDLGEQSVNSIAVDPQQPGDWYVGTDVGVWVTQDSGISWRPYGAALPNALISDLEIQPAFGWLYAATHGRGLWRAETLSKLASPPAARTPLVLEIASQNPSAGQFSIRFAVRGGSVARVEVFSAQGRRIAQLAEAPGDGMPRELQWKPTGLASGIYFLVLRSGLRDAARKIALVR